jgi:ribosomal protein S18 acetylase RimI-like enzyme
MGKESNAESAAFLESKRSFLNHNGTLRYGINNKTAVLVVYSLSYTLNYKGFMEVEALTEKDFNEAANVSGQIRFESKFMNLEKTPLAKLVEIERKKTETFTKDKNLYFVGKVQGKIIGVIRFKDDGVKDGTFAVGILKEYSGKAYGKKLIHTLMSKLRHRGYETLTLDVDKNNAVAFDLYKKMRFKIVDEDAKNYEMKFYFNE